MQKAQDRLNRRRNPTASFLTSSSPALSQIPCDSVIHNPVKASLCTQLNNSNKPETVLVHNSSFKQRKLRHRRVGSGCGISSSPRSSPQRERKVTIFVFVVT